MRRILLALITVFLAVTPAWSEFFQNGSFETGPFPPTGSFNTLYPVDNPSITGWTIGGGSIDWINSYWQHSQGSKSIDLNGLSQGWISQTFDTVAGTTYRVTFDMAGNPDGDPTDKYLRVTAPGVTRDFSFNITGLSLTNMGWVTNTFVFTASDPSTTLRFDSLVEGPNPYYGPALDNVTLAAVPIPAAAWLLGTGLIGLVMIRRRLKK